MDFDLVMLAALPASFLIFLGIEALLPSGRPMPEVRRWRSIGLACFAGTLAVYVDRIFGTYAAPGMAKLSSASNLPMRVAGSRCSQ